jgi:hypothetical protein
MSLWPGIQMIETVNPGLCCLGTKLEISYCSCFGNSPALRLNFDKTKSPSFVTLYCCDDDLPPCFFVLPCPSNTPPHSPPLPQYLKHPYPPSSPQAVSPPPRSLIIKPNKPCLLPRPPNFNPPRLVRKTRRHPRPSRRTIVPVRQSGLKSRRTRTGTIWRT